MDTTKHKMQELRNENKRLRDCIKDIVKLIKKEPYSHNQKVFDLTASVSIHENLID